MEFPNEVELIEVGPRDGLQNEPEPISVEQKKRLIRHLAEVGFSRIESTAFVHPKWVPQMADAEEIAAYCNELGFTQIALTPNERAIDRAIAMGVPQVAVFIGASTQFNQRNINRTTDESLAACAAVFEKARRHNMFVRAYISMAFSCPFQGEVTFEEVNHVCKRFVELGADEIDIGDTNGRANPRMVYERFSRLRDLYPTTTFVGHFHDTYHVALANVIAAMQAGVRKFDASVGGLGGCPYSPGATGNVATERLAYMLSSMGIATGIDDEKLKALVPFAQSLSTRL
ncbi:hydroxymethylglutaryl-CoA lyase [Alicyclobacillus cycloheptanicus]|uniref:Hydroxymethylglutaryl-CoA lyase n=1 Tax=Alicyclobacillus cycloheptanicus TaxID=1457 RepID=A0ABT9XGV9_9BACL|nr:hydroxymethylglutaryl-CoA lyase [Alicyclobacillus cycloheptanicus]MDQ0189537.1 hydroxymethylglutaryl-CoA lyase [Alicyclobacillus cycloheptanicus]WDM01592.1 hydroxymethylglutaryl-CoA lyase [Alicyclobacillus cycloheptanicus]